MKIKINEKENEERPKTVIQIAVNITMIIIEENTYQHPSLPNFQHKQMLKMMNLLKKEKKNRDVKHKTAAMIFIAGQK